MKSTRRIDLTSSSYFFKHREKHARQLKRERDLELARQERRNQIRSRRKKPLTRITLPYELRRFRQMIAGWCATGQIL